MWRESESDIDDHTLSAHILVNLFAISALPKFRSFAKEFIVAEKWYLLLHIAVRGC